MPTDSDNPIQEELSVVVDHIDQQAVKRNGVSRSSEKKVQPTPCPKGVKVPPPSSVMPSTATQQTRSRDAMGNKPKCNVSCQLHIGHGLPSVDSVQFHTFVLPNNLSSLVSHVVDRSVPFGGNVLIDEEDLATLKGCRSTSEGKFLTNFTIEGYFDLIAKQGRLQGKNIEYLGWERFDKEVGRSPARDVLRGKAPPMHQDLLLVPCNPRGSQHWFLLAVVPKKHQILVLDSLAGEFVKPTAKRAVAKMWMLLEELDRNISVNQWSCYSNKPMDIPQQQNDYDRGVFRGMYARTLALQHPMPSDIPNFRQVMILELHQGTLQNLDTKMRDALC